MKIAVFGMGYVGCITGACLARDGHHVIGIDTDGKKVDEINAGTPPIVEPGISELLKRVVNSGNLRATTEMPQAVRHSDVGLICVGTPSDSDGDVSARAVRAVVASIGKCLREDRRPYCVVVRSTLMPGILEDELMPLLYDAAGRGPEHHLHVCNNPEFLRETTAIQDYDFPPFVLVGANDESAAKLVLDMYGGIKAESFVTDTRTAALVKYASNAFHALKVTFANEIGTVAKSAGTDGRRVMELVCKDHKLNISPAYLRPGFAFGGSCLPKDLRAVTRFVEKRALGLQLLPSILASNEQHVRRAVNTIVQSGHRKVGLLGLSFKHNTDDLRESPLVTLAETLVGRGIDLSIYDPSVQISRLRGQNLNYIDRHLPHLAKLLVKHQEQVLKHSTLLVLATDVANEVDWKSRFDGEVFDLRADLARVSAISRTTDDDTREPG